MKLGVFGRNGESRKAPSFQSHWRPQARRPSSHSIFTNCLLTPRAFSTQMEVVTVHAKPPKRLLRKRKRLLNTSISTDNLERDAQLGDDASDFSIRSTKRRKLKAEETTVDNLPWKTLTRPKSSNFDADVALMSLEEVDGVGIVYLDETKKRVSYNILVRYDRFASVFLVITIT